MKMIELFNEKEVSFVSVTQHFGTTDSTGRMFLGILITFALRKGDLHVLDETVDNSTLFGGRSIKAGEQYEVDFGDGVRAVCRPWSEKNLYAQRGEFELILPDRPDKKGLERAFDHMESIGLKAGTATPQDAELLYLHKQAYLTKVDGDPAYKAVVKELDRRVASKEERIREMRGFWERRLGVKDLTRMQGYDPLGEHQLAFKDAAKRGGYRHQYHRGSTPADWKKFAGRSSNETIFKYSVTFLDNIDLVVVGSDREKKRLMEAFLKRKITKLPDGRKVEDIILVR